MVTALLRPLLVLFGRRASGPSLGRLNWLASDSSRLSSVVMALLPLKSKLSWLHSLLSSHKEGWLAVRFSSRSLHRTGVLVQASTVKKSRAGPSTSNAVSENGGSQNFHRNGNKGCAEKGDERVLEASVGLKNRQEVELKVAEKMMLRVLGGEVMRIEWIRKADIRGDSSCWMFIKSKRPDGKWLCVHERTNAMR